MLRVARQHLVAATEPQRGHHGRHPVGGRSRESDVLHVAAVRERELLPQSCGVRLKPVEEGPAEAPLLELVAELVGRSLEAAPWHGAVGPGVEVGHPLEHGELRPEVVRVHGRVSCLVVIVETSMQPDWLSNAYLVADEAGGHGVIIDSGGPSEPLLQKIDELDLTIPYLLLTHHHGDHVAENHVYKERFGVEILAHPLEAEHLMDVDRSIEPGELVEAGDLRIDGIHTPGHTAGEVGFPVEEAGGFPGGTPLQGPGGGRPAAG